MVKLEHVLHRIIAPVKVRLRQITILGSTVPQRNIEPSVTVLNRDITTGTQIIAQKLAYLPSQVERPAKSLLRRLVIIIIHPCPYRSPVGKVRSLQFHFLLSTYIRSTVKSHIRNSTGSSPRSITARHHVILFQRTVQRQSNLHRLRQIRIQVYTHITLTQSRALYQTLDILVRSRSKISNLVRTTIYRQRIILRKCRTVNLFLPVDRIQQSPFPWKLRILSQLTVNIIPVYIILVRIIPFQLPRLRIRNL